MLFTKLVTEDDIILDLRAEDIREALEKVLELAVENGYLSDKDEVLKRVVHKEKVKPTVLGDEVLAPHIASDKLAREFVIFARSRTGISVDDNKFRYIFFVGVPSKKRSKMFDILSDLAFAVRDREFLLELKAARNIDDVLFAMQKKRMPLITKLKRKLARLQAALA